MSTAAMVPPPNSSSLTGRVPQLTVRVRALLTELNLHFAGVALLGVLVLYLGVHLFLVWQGLGSVDAAAMDQQRVALKSAELAAKPLRGLDAKLVDSTGAADEFYAKRLPYATSQVLAELGALTKREGVRLTRSQYAYTGVLSGDAALTEMRIDAGISGDYRPIVQFINAAERDKMFFVINGINLSGQQTGQVNLRVRLTTYLRAPQGDEAGDELPVASDGTKAGGDAMSAQRQSAAAEEQRKRLIVYGVFAAALLAFVVFAYTQFFGGSAPAPMPVVVAPVVVSKPTVAASAPKATGAAAGLGAAPGVAAVKMASTSSSLDPTLDETAMLRTESLIYAGSGRNIFSATYVPPVVIPKNAPPARPVATAQPAVYVPQGPPPPPPINLKFFGTEMRSNGQRQAFLLQGEDVYLAAQGDIVARRYKIVSIGENHIEVEDLVNNNKQSLPLQMN